MACPPKSGLPPKNGASSCADWKRKPLNRVSNYAFLTIRQNVAFGMSKDNVPYECIPSAIMNLHNGNLGDTELK